MAWRKWLVRGVVYGIVAVCTVGTVAYQRWTNPVAVRAQIASKLSQIFPGASVSVDSANLRLLGGIQLNDLRLVRRDDPEHNEFLHVPSAIFYHDKEKILEGELTLRKVELYRPRLRLRRDRDGKWNVQGLTRPGAAPSQLPTIVVHQGTLIFEDRLDGASKASALEVNDVTLTLINDPLPTVTIRGAANSDLLGKLRWQGSWQRPTNEVALGLKAADVPLTQSLLLRFVGQGPAAALQGLALDARADLRAQVAWHPAQVPPLSYDISCQVRKGKVQHPQLPLPLEDLTASFRCADGELRLERLKARSGAAEVALSGSGRFPGIEQDFEAEIDVQHLALCEELSTRLPDKIRSLYRLFQPQGPTTLHIACARHGSQWTTLASGKPSQVSLRPENLSIAFLRFPYPVQKLTGALNYDLHDRHVQVDMTGYAGERPVFIQGDWIGEGRDADARFDIHAADVKIEDAIIDALPLNLQKLTRSFRAEGKFDVKAHIRHEPGAPEYRNEFHLRFHDATVKWESFPYPLEGVAGVLDIYPKHWEFHEFQGVHHGGHVVVNGRSSPAAGEGEKGVCVEIVGRNVAMDEDLRQALGPVAGLQRAWDTFRPTGRLTFTASIDRPTAQSYDLGVQVDAQGCAVNPSFFAYPMREVDGQFRYHHHRLELAKVHARHDDTKLTLDQGTIDLHPGGGHYADVQASAEDLRLDDALISALPHKLQAAARAAQLHGPVRVQSRLVVAQAPEPASPPDIFWDGQAWLKKVKLTTGLELSDVTGTVACTGRYNGQQLLGIQGNALFDTATTLHQPFTNIRAPFEVRPNTPDVLLLGLRAPLYGGDIAGQVRVDMASTVRYELNLTASQIDLAQFGEQNLGRDALMQGTAVGRLHLSGQGSSIDTLDGNGSLDVPNGRLGKDLPLLLDLLKFLGLHWPDRTAFEELHARFAVHGKRVAMRHLDLVGNAVSLTGKGEFNLDGSDVQLDFYPTWARLEQFLPPLMRPLPPAVSKNLLTIEMRGRVGGKAGDLRFNKKLVPIVIDPLTVLRDRVVGATPEKKTSTP